MQETPMSWCLLSPDLLLPSYCARYVLTSLNVRKSKSWGSDLLCNTAGVLPLLWTCPNQSKRSACALRRVSSSLVKIVEGTDGGSSSRKTLHFAVESKASLPTSPKLLPQMSSSSRLVLCINASARLFAPSSPMQLSRNESLRIAELRPRINPAIILAPSSPTPFSPRLSSRTATCCCTAVSTAKATARTPLSPRRRPLSSSAARCGGADLHSSSRLARQAGQTRARSRKVGSKSRQCWNSSVGKSCRRNRGFGSRLRVVASSAALALALLA
mmetsp:Transcript_58899/g.113596  ORF Transcript_58899/g.113596 Transcript_58899/m.113596 type:complete len:272 (-) Transcript_58899:617-1432(-)